MQIDGTGTGTWTNEQIKFVMYFVTVAVVAATAYVKLYIDPIKKEVEMLREDVKEIRTRLYDAVD